MQDTITRYLTQFPDVLVRRALQFMLNPVADRLSSNAINSANLAINGAGNAAVKIGASDFYGIAQGKLVKIAAATVLPVLVGSVTNAKFNVFAFYSDFAGNLTSQMGTEGAALNTVVLPVPPVGQILIGYAVINPTGAGNFVGGTTALDSAGVVPNAAYINLTGPADPSILL
jgi:hypothetical protein